MSNIWGVYSPQIFDGRGSVKYLVGVHPPNISRKGFRQIFGGCTAPKYLTEGVPSTIWWMYGGCTAHQIFDGRGSVKYLVGGTATKYLTEGVPSNIWWALQPPNI